MSTYGAKGSGQMTQGPIALSCGMPCALEPSGPFTGPWTQSPLIKPGRSPALLVVLALLTACADRSGCPDDLVAFGQAEGERGELATLPHDRCELSEAERDRYFAARAQGLAVYCEPQRGFDVGLGGELLDVEACPIDRRAKFQSANQTANFLVEKEARRDELLVEARELEARVADAYEPEAGGLRQEAAAKRMDARQEENDLEALRGVAIVEGWMAPPELPSEPMPPPVED